MSSWIPQTPGLLPWALLINAGLSWYNTFNAYFDRKLVRRLYKGPNGSQVTDLSARTFGCWTILSGFVRFYAAYNITNPQVYALAFCSYVAIDFHWITETFVFHTTRLGGLTYVNLFLDCGLLLWTFLQWEHYTSGI